MNEVYDVAIIGGGVVGCAIARELSRYRLKTVLLEKYAEVGFGTTKTNSGIVHAGHHSSPDTLKGQLVVRGNEMFDELQEELGFGFRRCGEIVVAQDEEEMEHLKELQAMGEKKGVAGLEMWDQERLRKEEPNLSTHLVGALHAPTAGVINPYEFAFALIECAQQNGAQLLVEFAVEEIVQDEKSLTVVAEDGRHVTAKYVLNAAGVHSDVIAKLVGLEEFSIQPRKGEEYMLDKRLQGIVKRLVFPVPKGKSKGTLIIPTYDGTIMVGPTAEEVEDRYDFTTTNKGSDKVFEFVSKICPSIHARHTIAEFAGLRAASNTGDFIIGTTSVRGFINVAGVQSPGLTASPAIAQYVVNILGKEGLPLVEKESFEAHVKPPPRFAQLKPIKQRELAESDPLFGRVVCRCELVTEAEIHQAIDHGARTIDGVKFRTRAGMGRCQGGFCSARIMEILSERLEIPITEVTKRGKSSWIVTPMMDDAQECCCSCQGKEQD